MHELRTDVEIDVELMAKGIAKEDLIAGMVESYTLEKHKEIQNITTKFQIKKRKPMLFLSFSILC